MVICILLNQLPKKNDTTYKRWVKITNKKSPTKRSPIKRSPIKRSPTKRLPTKRSSTKKLPKVIHKIPKDFVVSFEPMFMNKSDGDLLEYYQLPSKIGKEVISYFNSKQFSDMFSKYILVNEATITKIDWLVDENLIIYVHCKLSPKVTDFNDYKNGIEDGLYKAGWSGGQVSYGKYLGDLDDGRIEIKFNYNVNFR